MYKYKNYKREIEDMSVTLPKEKVITKIKAVSTMIRNCLIKNNEKLKDVDFNHLKASLPSVGKDLILPVEVSVKQNSEVRYRLESKKVYQFSRVDTNEVLNELGFTERTLPKAQYDDLVKLLEEVGTFTVTVGDIASELGLAKVEFNFGVRNNETVALRTLDLNSDEFVKSDLNYVFHTPVTFTFTAPDVIKEDLEEPKPTEPKEEEKLIDIAPLFTRRTLTNIFNN